MTLLNYILTPYTLLALPVVFLLAPYLRNWSLKDIPAPFPAQWTNLWLLWQCRNGRRYKAVDDAHKRYGKLVRIQPNHVSIADADAIPIIYGHGNGFLKRYREATQTDMSNADMYTVANTTMPSSRSNEASSTQETVPSTLGSARLCRIPSVPSRSDSSSSICTAI